jgi:signal transduction histidine kinase
MTTGVVEFLALLVALLAFLRAWRDHSTLKVERDELQYRALESERLLRLRGNLAREIAHEIKNPISAILCSAETLDLLIGRDLAEEHRVSLHYIKEYGDNLLQLVSDFLDVSMAESGHLKVNPEPIMLEPQVVSVIGLLESHAIRKKIKLDHKTTGDNLRINADPKHFKQIVFNLVHNAIRFTPDGGQVEVVVKSDFPNPNAIIYVRDNGVGIPEKEIPGLFDLYARYEGNQPKFGSGLGLGLALVKTLTELAGGTIQVNSTVGVGSSFEIKFPLLIQETDSKESEQQVADIKDGQPLLGQSFLLVDKEGGSRDSVMRLIEAWGGVVHAVTEAEEAVSALSTQSFDAVMIDANPGDIPGSDIAEMIRNEFDLGETTVIVSADSNDAKEKALKAGADSCIAKPYNGKVLLSSLIKSGKYSVN